MNSNNVSNNVSAFLVAIAIMCAGLGITFASWHVGIGMFITIYGLLATIGIVMFRIDKERGR